jgi:plasmid stabilization system protein ParE
MAYKIERKKRYIGKLERLLQYLEEEYGVAVAIGFLQTVERKVLALKHHPYIGASSGIKNARSLHVTMHNRLFYKVVGNKVILLNLYDTRTRTYKKPD